MNRDDLSCMTGEVQTSANSGEADLALFSDIAIVGPIYAPKTERNCEAVQPQLCKTIRTAQDEKSSL